MSILTQSRRASEHTPVADRAREMVAGLDWLLMLVVAGLSAWGLYVIREGTKTDVRSQPTYYFDRQLMFVVAGVVVFAVVASINPEWLQSVPWVLLGALLGALAVVFAIGGSVNGSVRWIDVGPFGLQPSEFGKVLMVLILSGLAVERMGEMEPWRLTAFLGLVTAVPALVVFMQPDLGTSLVYWAIYLGVLVMILTPWQHFAVMGGSLVALVVLVVGVLPAIGLPVLKDYQAARITVLFNPDSVDSDTRLQITQAKIGIGAGGATGKGADGATQSTRAFIPEHHTDFIFSVVGEMFGFIGSAVVIILFGIVVWRALRISARAPTEFEQVVAGAVAAMFIFQVFVNIGMNIGVMPVTGIPLPFLSYGGSHTLTNFAAIGLLIAIGRRRVNI